MDGYVESGKFPGSTMILAQGGDIVHRATTGWLDAEAGKPFQEDTIVRIFSMTKPIASVALMMLMTQFRIWDFQTMVREATKRIALIGEIRVVGCRIHVAVLEKPTPALSRSSFVVDSLG